MTGGGLGFESRRVHSCSTIQNITTHIHSSRMKHDAAPQIDHLLGQALHDHSVMVHRQQISDISRETDDMAQESTKGVASYDMPRQTACRY